MQISHIHTAPKSTSELQVLTYGPGAHTGQFHTYKANIFRNNNEKTFPVMMQLVLSYPHVQQQSA